MAVLQRIDRSRFPCRERPAAGRHQSCLPAGADDVLAVVQDAVEVGRTLALVNHRDDEPRDASEGLYRLIARLVCDKPGCDLGEFRPAGDPGIEPAGGIPRL